MAWKAKVAAPAAGRADRVVICVLADALERPRRDVSIVAGHGSREKIVSFDGISAEELDARLTSASSGERAFS
jgi:uncharacterized protein YggU (UPF0235/DUF167 family)